MSGARPKDSRSGRASAASLNWVEEYYDAPSITFKELIDTFCTQLPTDGLATLRAFCEEVGMFRSRYVDGLDTWYLLSRLKTFGMINQHNLQLLKYVARACDEGNLLELINQFEKNRCSSVDSFPSNSENPAPSIPGYAAVNVYFRESDEEMSHDRIESLCGVLADVSGIGYHELAWLGYKVEENGRIALMTVLPNKCLPKLQSRLSQSDDNVLQDVGIVDVEFFKQNTVANFPTSSSWNSTVEVLLKKIESGESLLLVQHDGLDYQGAIDDLINYVIQTSNFPALDTILRNMPRRKSKTMVDVLLEKAEFITTSMLPNAYVAGREDVVRFLVEIGFVLQVSDFSYTVLLATVCQIKEYPRRLLEFLLDSEEDTPGAFKDRNKDDVYEQCIRYCCINDRDDLVELFLERGAELSLETTDRFTSCSGRAMARIGRYTSSDTNVPDAVQFVDIRWQQRGLVSLRDEWMNESNLGAFVVSLDVSGNRLSSIPISILNGTLPCLEEVNCSQNKLQRLWSEGKSRGRLTKNYSLKIFNASQNELQELPLHLFQIPSLQIVNVSGNKLSRLPGPDTFYQSLSRLINSGETMEHWWLCPQLQELNVSHNRLSMLPETFDDVQLLRKLNAAGNEIAVIPRSLERSRCLEVVDLSHNCLGSSSVGSSLRYLPKSIQKLKLSSNKLDCIPVSLLSVSRLRQLDCANNCIRSIPYKNEWHLPHLESLILRGNLLDGDMDFPESFSNTLTFLDVSDNMLQKFPSGALHLQMAVSINLERNPMIDTLPSSIATLKRLWELKIDNLGKLMQQFDSTFMAELRHVRYSEVSHLIRDAHYQYVPYCGSKLSVLGSKTARDRVIRGLHFEAGMAKSLLSSSLPTVTNLVISNTSLQQAVSSLNLVKRLANRHKRAKTSDRKPALFKMWNVADIRSFVVLQHVFFTDNTIHLLVWHESDGLSGLDELEEFLQLIRTTKNEVLTALVIMTTRPCFPDIQQRLDVLTNSFGLDCIINVDMTRQRTNGFVFPLSKEIMQMSSTLARFCDNVVGHWTNRVPKAYHSAASKLICAEPTITAAVCTRRLIDWQLFPGSLGDPDDFDKAMRFLRRIGALLHFEDTPRNLHEHFFVDMDLISRLLVALTGTPCGHLCTGVAHLRHIYAVFSQQCVSEQDSDAIFALFVKLGVAVPLSYCRCLLPFRLPGERNGMNLTLSQYLTPCDGEFDSTTPTYVRRLYSVSELPPSFWGRFISSLVLQIQSVLDSEEGKDEKDKTANTVFWASGILSDYDQGCFIVNQVLKDDTAIRFTKPPEHSKRCVESGLDVVVFDRRRQFAALGLICSNIEKLLQEWIDDRVTSDSTAETVGLTVNRFVPYPPFTFRKEQPEDEVLYDFIFEHAIPEDAVLVRLEDCAQSIVESKKSILNKCVDVGRLAPDFNLAILPPSEHLNEEDTKIDVTSSGNLGRGSFASVVLGYHKNDQVAIKMFRNTDLNLPNFSDLLRSDKGHNSQLIRPRSRSERLSRFVGVFRLKSLPLFVNATGDAANSIQTSHVNDKPSQCFKHLQDLVQEVTVMKQLHHKHIVKFKGVLFEPYPCLVMEFAPGGNLATLIKRRREVIGTVTDLVDRIHFGTSAHDGIMGRELTHKIAFQIALGIEYLHGKAICHLDLKPENVLVWSESVTDPVNVKLTDYGISCAVTPHGVTNRCGTRGYQAPEQIATDIHQTRSFDFRVDVFAYGMMMYYLLTGVHPFESDMNKPGIVEHKIRQNHRPQLPTGQSLVHLQTLIDRSWRYWPSERPSAIEMVAEMREPTFHLQCQDLAVNCDQQVLTTTVVQVNTQIAGHIPIDDTVDGYHSSTASEFGEESISSDMFARLRLNSLAHLPLLKRLSRKVRKISQVSESRKISQGSEGSESRKISQGSGGSESRKISQGSESRKISQGSEGSEPQKISEGSESRKISQGSESRKISQGRESSRTRLERITETDNAASSELQFESSDDQSVTKLLSCDEERALALLLTSDSLLLADPRLSSFVWSHKTKKVKWDDVSAVMLLNDRLWVGLYSKQLHIFECIGGEVTRRQRLLIERCNDVVQEIYCQFSDDHIHAWAYAKLANGDIMVIRGQRYHDRRLVGSRTSGSWLIDPLYQWNQPSVIRVGITSLGKENGCPAKSCLLLATLGELWYCQSRSIAIVNTAKSPAEAIHIPDTPDGNILLPIEGTVEDAVVLEDSVWCCSESSICTVDVASRTPTRCCSLKELTVISGAQTSSVHPPKTYVSQKLASIIAKKVLCLATVYDTLWVGCDHGGILVLCRSPRQDDKARILATLWCSPILNHVVFKKQGQLPSMAIAKMTQIGDRVLVYYNREDQRVRVEIFQALSSSQLQELTTCYNTSDE